MSFRGLDAKCMSVLNFASALSALAAAAPLPARVAKRMG